VPRINLSLPLGTQPSVAPSFSYVSLGGPNVSLRHSVSYSASELAQAGRDVEKVVLARALKLVFEERVFLSGNRTIIFE